VRRTCCGSSTSKDLGLAPNKGQACQIVLQLLETETEPEVMEQLINNDGGQPNCYLQFPPANIARLCWEGCGHHARSMLVNMLGELDPSPEIRDALLHQLRLPSEGSRDDADTDVGVALALADTGEAELALVVDSLLSSNQRSRKAAMMAFSYALQKAPLELPSLLLALEALEKDNDPELALGAQMNTDRYRRWSAKSVEQAVAELMLIEKLDDKRNAIRMLAVRRFSCSAKTAEEALAQLARDPDPDMAVAAKHAIELRAKRCVQGN
jgi:hypothetical protein